jgi:hypothetical protein
MVCRICAESQAIEITSFTINAKYKVAAHLVAGRMTCVAIFNRLLVLRSVNSNNIFYELHL